MIQIKKYFYHFGLLSFDPLSFDPVSFDPLSVKSIYMHFFGLIKVVTNVVFSNTLVDHTHWFSKF